MGVFSWIALGTLFLHLIPFSRLMTRPIRALLKHRKEWRFPFPRWMVLTGRWEYLLGPIRDRLLSLILLIWMVIFWWTQDPITPDTWMGSSFIILFNLLAIINLRYRDGMGLKAGELGRIHPNFHPEDFFNLYYVLLCPWPPPFPESGFRTVSYNEVNYQTGRSPIQTLRPTLEGALSSSTLSRFVMLAVQKVGVEHGRNVFDGLSRIWGSRIAYLFQLKLVIKIPENSLTLEGKTLLVFNHQSVLDFALNFFALGGIRARTQGHLDLRIRHLRPRFIAAKDHFIDNPFLYSWLGLGKVSENVGMVFVDRKQKGKGWEAMAEAAEKLTQADMEIAVYPQGTRAIPLKSFSGLRQDAGLYTTCSAKHWQDPLGHLKPGTAHLILESLMKLYEKGEKQLNVLIVGIRGAGIAGPKGAWRVQTETEIQYCIEKPWVIATEEVAGLKIPQNKIPQDEAEERYVKKFQEIQQQLGQRLAVAMNWHARLIEHFQKELPQLNLTQEEEQLLLQQLREAELKGETRPFILLERIMALPTQQWSRFFQLWLAVERSSQNSLEPQKALDALLQEVTEKLLMKE